MNMHSSGPFCTHIFMPFCCISLCPSPAAVVPHPCSGIALIITFHLTPLKKTMQGKIKGRGTRVREKPCLHSVWRGTHRSVVCAARYCTCVPWHALAASSRAQTQSHHAKLALNLAVSQFCTLIIYGILGLGSANLCFKFSIHSRNAVPGRVSRFAENVDTSCLSAV